MIIFVRILDFVFDHLLDCFCFVYVDANEAQHTGNALYPIDRVFSLVLHFSVIFYSYKTFLFNIIDLFFISLQDLMNIFAIFIKSLNISTEYETRFLNDIQNCRSRDNFTQDVEKKRQILVLFFRSTKKKNPIASFIFESNSNIYSKFLFAFVWFVCRFFVMYTLKQETLIRECQTTLQSFSSLQSIIKIQSYIRCWTVTSDFKKLRMLTFSFKRH